MLIALSAYHSREQDRAVGRAKTSKQMLREAFVQRFDIGLVTDLRLDGRENSRGDFGTR